MFGPLRNLMLREQVDTQFSQFSFREQAIRFGKRKGLPRYLSKRRRDLQLIRCIPDSANWANCNNFGEF